MEPFLISYFLSLRGKFYLINDSLPCRVEFLVTETIILIFFRVSSNRQRLHRPEHWQTAVGVLALAPDTKKRFGDVSS